ncbi:S8 family serine peptidase [bacterium]|nr:S8 family serine peptidase [bacterium]
MKQSMSLTLGFILLVTMFVACSEETQNPIDATQSDEAQVLHKLSDRYLVEYSNGNKMMKALENAGGTLVEDIDAIKVAIVSGLTDQAAQQLANSNGIQKVTRDMKMKFVPSLQEALAGSAQHFTNPQPTGAPGDASALAIQWNMHAIHAPEAWATTTGSSEIRVGILDTGGSPDHIDLYGKYDEDYCINFSEEDNYNPAIWVDRHFHGTHVAGTVATNNIVVAGVASDVTLVAIKVMNDNGEGWFEDIIRGIVYATDVADCDIINMSLGGYGPRAHYGNFISTVIRAVNYANSHGVLVVMSAGNEMLDLDHSGQMVYLPAEAGAGVVVSATGPVDQANFDDFACFSNYGNSFINVAAPGGNGDCGGVGIVNTYDGVLSCYAPWVAANVDGLPNPTGYYVWAWGTSMAAPHVCGTAALIEAAKGNSNPGYLQAHLQNTADDLGAPGNDPYYGKGRINAATAVR